MGLSKEEVRHIAILARVGMTEADIAKAQEQLSVILENFEVLKEVDTTNVPPTSYAIALHSVTRPDDPRPSFPASEILANAPRKEQNLFRVKQILEE